MMETQTQTRADSQALLSEEQLDRTALKTKKVIIPDHWILVLKTGISGMIYYVEANKKYQILGELVPGTELKLERDYTNPHDEWAVAVFTPKGTMLGYVTRYKNESIARLMDVGKSFHAVVDKPTEKTDELDELRTPTEDYDFPFSIYMEDENYCGEDELI